jgi:hypothetical protein
MGMQLLFLRKCASTYRAALTSNYANIATISTRLVLFNLDQSKLRLVFDSHNWLITRAGSKLAVVLYRLHYLTAHCSALNCPEPFAARREVRRPTTREIQHVRPAPGAVL